MIYDVDAHTHTHTHVHPSTHTHITAYNNTTDRSTHCILLLRLIMMIIHANKSGYLKRVILILRRKMLGLSV